MTATSSKSIHLLSLALLLALSVGDGTSGATIAVNRQQQQQQVPHARDNHTQINQTSGNWPFEELKTAELSQELHFGAKIAIASLTATIMLVAAATFADYQLGGATRADLEPDEFEASCQSVSNQIQRSHSLSSSCSSNLFCSANSVASASAPILGKQRNKTSEHQTTIRCHEPGRQRKAARHDGKSGENSLYQFNIQMLISSLAPIQCDCKGRIESLPAAADEVDAFRHQQSPTHLIDVGARESERNWSHSVDEDNQTDCGSSSGASRSCLGWMVERQTLWELFLSFSMLRSAALIFQDSNQPTSQSTRHAPDTRASTSSLARSAVNCGKSSCCGHRSRVSSLSSINEKSYDEQDDIKSSSSDLEENSMVVGARNNQARQQLHQRSMQQQQQHNQNPPQHRRHFQAHDEPRLQSIDSLHGLRFLSMIWVIVIHSYNFALRWLFFAQTSNLENLYKTTASQLLANGSFACDSFFFAAGFLLPYLAFPAKAAQPTLRSATGGNPSASSKWISKQQQQRQQQQHEPGGCSPQQRTACSSPDSQIHDQSAGCSLACAAPQVHVVNAMAVSEQNVWNNQQQQQRNCCPARQPQCRLAHTNEFTLIAVLGNILHRYIRMMPLMMAIIGLSATLLRYFGEGPAWEDSTLMFDKWCRKNWWVNALFLHNFVNRENMCLSHSWYSAVDIQLFLLGQLILVALFRSRRLGLLLCAACLLGSQLVTGVLTILHHLPAVPLISSVDESTMNLYYGEIYIKPYSRASPYLIGILLAYLMRTTSLGQLRLRKWQLLTGWTLSLATFAAILLAMQPAMNGQPPGETQSALYSALSRPLWACATGWMIFACMTKQGGPIQGILSARLFAPFSRLTYPAFLIHPIVMAVFYGSRQTSFHFSHYLMLYLILGNIVITYASAFVLSALFELPLLSAERALKRAWRRRSARAPARH